MDRHLLLFTLIGGLVLIISVFASKATSRFGFPILLLFIGVGMLLGRDGIGKIAFDNYRLTHLFGTVALIYILFAGGLSSLPSVMKPVWKEGVTLATAGVFLTALFMTALIHYTMHWNWPTSALLSAAVSSTDAAAVFGILRTQKSEVRSRLRGLVELESGSNDPMSVILLLLLMQFAHSPETTSFPEIAEKFFIQIALGGLAGWFLGRALVRIINWLNLDFEGLYPVLTLASVFCIYSLSEYCGGNGFLAVFVAGQAMSGLKFISKKSLLVFHDGLSWLMQVGMFLMLGLLVNPRELGGVVLHGSVFALGLIFIVRPIVVSMCLIPFGHRNWRDLAFISWAGIKGAVAIILAAYLLMDNVQHAKVMFNVIFFIVIISMALQGSTIGKVSKLLGVCDERRRPVADLWPYSGPQKSNEFIEFEVPADSDLVGKMIFELNLPDEVLVVLIHRDEDDFIPKGSTEIRSGDRVVCRMNHPVKTDNVALLTTPVAKKTG
jgi:cell volume regulation protein A